MTARALLAAPPAERARNAGAAMAVAAGGAQMYSAEEERREWFYAGADEEPQGPFVAAQLRELNRGGLLPADAQWCTVGMHEWQPLEHIPQLIASIGLLVPSLLDGDAPARRARPSSAWRRVRRAARRRCASAEAPRQYTVCVKHVASDDDDSLDVLGTATARDCTTRDCTSQDCTHSHNRARNHLQP